MLTRCEASAAIAATALAIGAGGAFKSSKWALGKSQTVHPSAEQKR